MKSEKLILAFSVVAILLVYVGLSNVQSSKLKTLATETKYNASPANSKIIANKKLVFFDEFNGEQIDSKRWATCYDWRKSSEIGCTNGGNFEQQWYMENQVELVNGKAILNAIKRNIDVSVAGEAKSFPYQSGMINSGRGTTDGSIKWSGTYGYYEAKIKFNKGQGVWPAFWLLPVDREWPPEIDIMEFVGNKPDQILHTLHWPGVNGPLKSDTIHQGKSSYNDNWNTYAVDWREDRIDWFINGVKTKSYTGDNVPNKPMEVILNLAIGGTLPGKIDNTTPAVNRMEIDYVRVYQSPEHIRPINR